MTQDRTVYLGHEKYHVTTDCYHCDPDTQPPIPVTNRRLTTYGLCDRCEEILRRRINNQNGDDTTVGTCPNCGSRRCYPRDSKPDTEHWRCRTCTETFHKALINADNTHPDAGVVDVDDRDDTLTINDHGIVPAARDGDGVDMWECVRCHTRAASPGYFVNKHCQPGEDVAQDQTTLADGGEASG